EERRLDEDRRRDVMLEDERLDLGNELLGKDEVAGSDPGGDRLRKGREEDDAFAVGDLEQPWELLALEAKLAVGIVLEHQCAAVARKLHEAEPVLPRERAPAGVLESRNRVDHVAGPRPA